MRKLCRNYIIAIAFPEWLKTKLKISPNKSKTPEGYKEYESWLKNNHPLMYWFEYSLCDKLQDFVCYPYELFSSVRYYLKNRFITKTHYMKTGLPVGEWFDFDTRLFHSIINEFKIYVEEEVAYMSKMLASDEVKLKAKEENWGKREWAIYHFDWEIGETHEHQSESAKEKKAIYLWILDEYSQRKDPIEFAKPEPCEDCYSEVWKEEERQNKEDEEILTRIIKIRKTCWT